MATPAASWKDYIDFTVKRGDIDDLMIVDAKDGAQWSTSNPAFLLKEYKALIAQEDGSDREEVVNEAANLVKLIQGSKPAQGLRISGKKQQIIRNFKDDETGLTTIYGKFTQEPKGHTSAGCNEVLRLMGNYLAKSTWPAEEGATAGTNGSAPSWQLFIDKMLIGKGNVSQAMIISKTDGKVFAASPGFALKKYQAEIPQEDGTDRTEDVDETKLVLAVASGKKPSQGLRISEVKYQIIKSFTEEHSNCPNVQGKKGLVNCCLSTTNKVIIVALCDERQGHTVVNCTASVADVAKHLKGSGN